MRFDPSLRLTRLIVMKNDRAVFDERFRTGVNILRGDNGGGKTTIADFIFFSLGGEVRNWRPEALLCDYTYAEVVVNGSPITLRRGISDAAMRPLSVYWGGYEAAANAPIEKWQEFPFASRTAKKSFSDVLFEALGFPVVRGDQLESRLTMHQVLRLAYVDQTSPHDHLFYSEAFDRAVTREAVGDLVTGIYDARLYEIQFKLRDARVEYSAIEKELKAIIAILGPDDQTINASVIAQFLHNRGVEREQVYDKLRQFERGETEAPSATQNDKAISEVREELGRQATKTATLRSEQTQLTLTIADSDQFIEALQSKVEALDESTSVSDVLGPAAFDVCPACFAPLSDSNGDNCKVCHQPYTTDQHKTNAQRVKHELLLQIDESTKLQRERKARLSKVNAMLPAEEGKRQQLQARLNELSTRGLSRLESGQAEMYRQLGYLDREDRRSTA